MRLLQSAKGMARLGQRVGQMPTEDWIRTRRLTFCKWITSDMAIFYNNNQLMSVLNAKNTLVFQYTYTYINVLQSAIVWQWHTVCLSVMFTYMLYILFMWIISLLWIVFTTILSIFKVPRHTYLCCNTPR